jgi:nitrate/nitrite transport system substrate-binding protein
MRRWGQIAEAKPDAWYDETARKVYKPDVYLQAAKLLVEEGKSKEADFPWKSDGYKPVDNGFIDGIPYDGHKPNDYLAKQPIGLKGDQKIEGGQVVGG